MEQVVGPIQKDMKGKFSFDGRDVSFKFILQDLIKSSAGEEHEKYEAAIKQPLVVPVKSTIMYTDGKEDSYISTVERTAVASVSAKYDAHYNGLNGWSEIKGSYPRDWRPSKPQFPEWSAKETEIIGLFILGGWKFAASWKHGLQYAFPHRTKGATQAKWYLLAKKESYMFEYYEKKVRSIPERIIRAKKLCKAMMQEKMELPDPKPEPKPNPYTDPLLGFIY